MITDKEMNWLKSELETGRIQAAVAYKTIWALKNQQRHISQLESQLKNCQGKCVKVKRELYRGTGIIL